MAYPLQGFGVENLEKCLLPMFANRVLSFNMACTKAYAELLAMSRVSGLVVETADAFIINPWEATP
ncbi:hypothetical protein XfCFBP8356_010150 [Xylella fastidiosa subsp. sandyi]|uniref:hypothetical protein n=1 Tax=Xylella fastidiosa TaxID=2371 RepID=UPI0007078DC9|nr:hypothetical protein [Xylella fastidiosa]KQH72890.1 hypothetical protein AOT81_11365 [Xylella fastidiosa]KQH72934.1 hypothetical protein AOT81_11200 [Xylella fastidiosa]KQH73574.1 hypothetical protein AOT81_07125 [Xylella fastidiosa]WNY19870.1 hypothetical protein RO839_04445 [Xylella fastidiosa]WNY20034.1 hypothetical protein RO839_05355 [Xylella fastidiosa]